MVHIRWAVIDFSGHGAGWCLSCNAHVSVLESRKVLQHGVGCRMLMASEELLCSVLGAVLAECWQLMGALKAATNKPKHLSAHQHCAVCSGKEGGCSLSECIAFLVICESFSATRMGMSPAQSRLSAVILTGDEFFSAGLCKAVIKMKVTE